MVSLFVLLNRCIVDVMLSFQWPYSYDSCDVGTLPNQTYPGTSTPLAAVQNGDPKYNNELVRHFIISLLYSINAVS
jgi:hypothetical protein